MNKEYLYTSTGAKLIHHPDVIRRLQRHVVSPMSIQVAPTSRCQLNCCFCSNANREKHEDLDFMQLKLVLSDLYDLGAKTVEWTGGGDPTLYRSINEIIQICQFMGYRQGFITNGVDLKKLDKKTLDSLTWLRISMNSLDYVTDIEIPEFHGTLGFSYVMNEKTNDLTLNHLDKYVRNYKPKYVRVVPNCQATDEEQMENNVKYLLQVETWGEPYFYQAKTFQRPEQCYLGYLKPFMLHDGWVYPCSSVVLNLDADKTFHEKYRWCKIGELPSFYKRQQLDKKPVPFSTLHCNHCVFAAQNRLIQNIMYPDNMIDFI